MEYCIGDIVKVHDLVQDDFSVYATVRYIEQDPDYRDLRWLYLVANEEAFNTLLDNYVIGPYYTILEESSDRIELISRATMM